MGTKFVPIENRLRNITPPITSYTVCFLRYFCTLSQFGPFFLGSILEGEKLYCVFLNVLTQTLSFKEISGCGSKTHF